MDEFLNSLPAVDHTYLTKDEYEAGLILPGINIVIKEKFGSKNLAYMIFLLLIIS